MLERDEIIEIYKEVSNKLCNGTEWCWAGVGEPLQLFAKLVADVATAKEREACAKVCEEYETANDTTAIWLNIVAEAIRARSGATSRGEAK
jgi:hypothetical protein